MSNVHVEFIEDGDGDTVDIIYYHHYCAPSYAKGWPAPEALDYPVYCEVCRYRIEEVPLTEYGRENYEDV